MHTHENLRVGLLSRERPVSVSVYVSKTEQATLACCHEQVPQDTLTSCHV